MAVRRPPAGRPERPGRILALEGPSGVGKSSVARALASATGGAVLAEAFDRIRPTPSLEFRDGTELERLELRLLEAEGERGRDARALAAEHRWTILDTSFYGPVTYTHGLAVESPELALAEERVNAAARRLARSDAWPPIDALVYLSAPPGIVAGRVAGSRETHSAGVAERHARIARCERWLWLGRYRALAPSRLFVLPARSPVPGLVERIGSGILPRLDSLRVPPPDPPRIVEAFARPGAVPPGPRTPRPSRIGKR